jgi:hypothetical protein
MQVDKNTLGGRVGKTSQLMQSLDTRINNIQLLHVHTPQISSPGVEPILIYTLLYFRSDINH